MKCIGKLTLFAVPFLAVLVLAASPRASAQQKKPNIIVIFGDDVGYWNISAYNQGMMGYKTSNIDRIAHEERAHGFDVWQEPFVSLRVPMLEDLRADPFERAEDEAADYSHWRIDRIYLLVPAQAFVGQWLQSFREFPPRQKPASFSLDQVMENSPDRKMATIDATFFALVIGPTNATLRGSQGVTDEVSPRIWHCGGNAARAQKTVTFDSYIPGALWAVSPNLCDCAAL